MSDQGTNDPMVSHRYILWSDISSGEFRWECIIGSPSLFGKLKRPYFA